jgi:hypothetical protein
LQHQIACTIKVEICTPKSGVIGQAERLRQCAIELLDLRLFVRGISPNIVLVIIVHELPSAGESALPRPRLTSADLRSCDHYRSCTQVAALPIWR